MFGPIIKTIIKEGLKGNCVPLAVSGAVPIIKEKQRSQKHGHENTQNLLENGSGFAKTVD